MQRDCGGRKEVSGLPTSSASGNHRAHMALATGLGGDGERDAEAPRGQSGGECVGGPAGRVCRRQQRQARPRRGHGPPRLGSASTGTCSPGPRLSRFSLFVSKERGQERCRSQQFIPCSQEPLRGSLGGPAPAEGRERHRQPHEGQDTARGSLLSPAPRAGDAPGVAWQLCWVRGCCSSGFSPHEAPTALAAALGSPGGLEGSRFGTGRVSVDAAGASGCGCPHPLAGRRPRPQRNVLTTAM